MKRLSIKGIESHQSLVTYHPRYNREGDMEHGAWPRICNQERSNYSITNPNYVIEVRVVYSWSRGATYHRSKPATKTDRPES